MRRLVFTIWIAGVLGAPSEILAAQNVPPLPGTRVRVTFPCRIPTPSSRGDCRLVGVLARWEADSLAVTESHRTTPFAMADLQRVEASEGLRSYRFLGAGVGLGIGAGATILVLNSGGSNSLCDRSANQDALNESECLGLYALGAVLGAGLGYLVGGLFHHEQWTAVPFKP